jgi:hypothetical protein
MVVISRFPQVLVLFLACLALAACGDTTSSATTLAATTPEERAYITAMTDQNTRFTQTLGNLSPQVARPQFADEEWRQATTANIVTIEQIIKEADALTAPPSLVPVDDEYQGAMSYFATAMRKMSKGIDLQDANTLDSAQRDLERGQLAMKEATRLLQEFNATHQ